MPYLTETDFNAPSGELNRVITKALIGGNKRLKLQLEYLVAKYVHDQKPRYATYNDVIGALVSAYLEYTRRRGGNPEIEAIVNDVIHDFYDKTVAPYEDKKIAEHGDIYK